jgi:hypothetical protein
VACVSVTGTLTKITSTTVIRPLIVGSAAVASPSDQLYAAIDY